MFAKLIVNELTKILKRKVVYIFIIIAIIGIISSFGIVYINNKNTIRINSNHHFTTKSDIELSIASFNYDLKDETLTEAEKKAISKRIEILKYILDKGIENILEAEYKQDLEFTLSKLYEKLYSLDNEIYQEEYKTQENNIQRAWKILENGNFEEYIQFNKDLSYQKYLSKEITKEEYEDEIETQNNNLKYEIGKYMPWDTKCKNSLLYYISSNEEKVKNRIDLNTDQKYLSDKDIEILNNDILITKYRLENNIIPQYESAYADLNVSGYSRYTFNNFARTISVLIVGLLLIILVSSSISDEISKGTIKFTLIAPYSKSNLLSAKIVAIIILMFLIVFVISQISVLFSTIAFGANSNPYLYVNHGEVKIMSSYLYETLQYLLTIPKLIVYVLFGITLSTLTKSTPISIIISTVFYIGIDGMLNTINNFMAIDFLKYLPFNNFDFITKVFHLAEYENASFTGSKLVTMDLSYCLFILILTSILLLITAFDSFRKKEI